MTIIIAWITYLFKLHHRKNVAFRTETRNLEFVYCICGKSKFPERINSNLFGFKIAGSLIVNHHRSFLLKLELPFCLHPSYFFVKCCFINARARLYAWSLHIIFILCNFIRICISNSENTYDMKLILARYWQSLSQVRSFTINQYFDKSCFLWNQSCKVCDINIKWYKK